MCPAGWPGGRRGCRGGECRASRAAGERRHLPGYLARAAGNVGPAVAQGDDSLDGAGVVPVLVTPAGLQRVGDFAVGLHRDSELGVEGIAVLGPSVPDDPRLALRAGQPVGSLHPPDVPEFEHGVSPVADIGQCRCQLGAPAHSCPLAQCGPQQVRGGLPPAAGAG